MKVTGTDGKEYTIESEANLSSADLSDSKLNDANLDGADLSKADLTDANLSEAVWNGETVFPEGFEIPEKSGT